jgi:8-oxo-dGTP pyrophosphatase MutT (NUDIX family)
MSVIQNALQDFRDRLTARAGAHKARPQAGAIPYTVVQDQTVFLLITSRRTGRWIFPKGALDEGETPWELAAEEAFEEAGVRGTIEQTPIGSYRTMKTLSLSRQPIIVDLYPLRVEHQFDNWPEKGQRHRHWAILPEAKRLLSNARLAELAAAIARREPADQPSIRFISQ